MKKIIILFLLIGHFLTAQTIKGFFPEAKNTEIILFGYTGFDTKELAKITTNSSGNFELNYPKEYVGAAVLQIHNAGSVIILLHSENFEMHWENIKDFKTLKFISSPENDAFSKGISINQEAESKLSGLKYLNSQYEKYPQQKEWLQQEITNQEQQLSRFLNQLPNDSYAKYYLKIRKLITDFPQTANRYIERMPQHEIDFNTLPEKFVIKCVHGSGFNLIIENKNELNTLIIK